MKPSEIDPQHYSYKVIWSKEDDEYIGLCLEFPSMSFLSPVQDDAFAGITRLIKITLEDMLSDGEIPPIPLADRSYSGRFIVRIPPYKHRELVIEAKEQGISLNRLVSDKLTS